MDKQIKEIQKLLKKSYDRYFKASDGHCKMSEGHIYIREDYPTYWNYGKSSEWEVGVFSYVFGPHRMHEFRGKTKEIALNKALKKVRNG